MRSVFFVLAGALSLAGCASVDPPSQVADACKIFDQKPGWWKAAKKVERRYDVSPGYLLAVVRRESSFNADARPPREGGFLILPGKRPSSAYGYAQVKDDTWAEYKATTGRRGADRDDFADAADFIGWYADRSAHELKIRKSDYAAQYLAYHEGRGGYARGSYRGKSGLLAAARDVAAYAHTYDAQLGRCAGRLNGGFWFF